MRTTPAGHRANHPGELCIGLMSGTSVDAIDAALVRIKRTEAGAPATVELVAYLERPFPAEVRREVFRLFEQEAGAVARLCTLNVVLAEHFAEAALAVCRQAGVPPASVAVIGSHGQTVWHQPESDPSLPGSTPSTLQIGEPAVIAERTGIRVVANFRAADMAAGGQGAPLVPYFDWVMLRHPTRNRAVQNLGGIGNVTWLPAGGPLDAVRAFDTGPGNMVIDGLVTLLSGGERRFDEDGRLARAGRVDGRLLDRWLADPYLDQAPPKTTGRERYGLQYSRRAVVEAGLDGAIPALSGGASPAVRQRALDLIATATALTAHSIADAYRRWLPGVSEVIVGGGGSRNPVLVALLRDLLAPAEVTTVDVDRHGIDGAAKEAMAFALLAHDALLGLPTNVPGATGARYAVTLGALTPPG